MMKMMLMMKIVDDGDDGDSDDGADQGVNHILYGKTSASLFSISEQDYCPSLGKDDDDKDDTYDDADDDSTWLLFSN